MSGELYAIEGLAHLSMSRGSVLHLVKDGVVKCWTAKPFVALSEAPDVAAIAGKDTMIVVTTSSLVRIRSDKRMDTIFADAFWKGLYPNSMLIDDHGWVYIGMRQGVAKWHIGDKGESVQWMVPSREFLEEELARFNSMVRG